jgi:succinate dehydrogenase / fumarate reductase membrane anchor subunit
MSLESPLGRVLGLGAAGDGPAHWWSQRVSAVGLALLAIWFVVSLAGVDLASYGAVRAWLASPANTVLASLLLATLAYHSSLGVQVVIEDYVHGEGAKFAALMLNVFFTFAIGALCVFAILKLGFAG